MQNKKKVYIVAYKRSALCKANKGGFVNTRPDDLLASIIKEVVQTSAVNPADIEDTVIGCAFPEAEQGLNLARLAVLLAGLPDSVPGVTINRYCSSGINAIAMAANSIENGEIDVALAGGVESMTMIPMGGNNFSISPQAFLKDETVALAYGMGITAEKVALQWNVSRVQQDQFSYESHMKAIQAMQNGHFKDQILPIETVLKHVSNGKIDEIKKIIDTDDGIRADTTIEGLAKLKPAFDTKGSVTAGNSSQMTDGAAVVMLVGEDYLHKHNLKPLARFCGFSVAGVPASIMGIGPIKAIPKVLAKTGLSLSEIGWIELNEAFAAQSIAIINELGIDKKVVNPDGGAIALGHPLGATGAILAVKAISAMHRNNIRYSMVTMCIGAGMGAAAILERC
jgi:acetyl-CoA acyltransferase